MYNVGIVVLLFFNIGLLQAHERITSFVSDIFVNVDATIDVEETIEVISEHDTIVHGIVREFPTKYRTDRGFDYEVGFQITWVKHNGIVEPYTIKNTSNGKLIYIGDAYTVVSEGKHTYVIRYTTSHQLGFFKDRDEIYWNVTGNGWRLPIDRVEAYVYLPKRISKNSIKAQAYTGYQSEQGQNYQYSIDNNIVHFSTKHGLQKFQGMTIVATFPKGFIIEPLSFQSIYWSFGDKLIIIWLLLGMLILLGIFYARRMNRAGVIIPLFYPPAGMMPSEVGFMNKKYFRTMLLSTDVLDLAVHDLITIKYLPGFFYGGTYTLSKRVIHKNLNVETKLYHKELLTVLFGSSKTIELSHVNHKKINAALEKCRKHVNDTCSIYITKPTMYYFATFFLGLFFCGPIVYFLIFYIDLVIISICFAIPFLNKLNILCNPILLVQFLFSVYTPEGRKQQDAIDGFKMYLMTAEVDRMHFIGTPPTKTPELYEKYLPYAIALGIEKQWTQQFSMIFKEILRTKGDEYHYSWSRGSHFRFNNFGSSFSNSISSASAPPGSSSGSGGRGRSGGGGGGGGGGGW